MPEVLFYQLERRPLAVVLPGLLQISLARGWRVVVKVGSAERLEALNAELWSFDEASFLPHGSVADGNAEQQPIWLTVGDDNPNAATVRFLIDGAEAPSFTGFDRTVFLFEGNSPENTAAARAAWRAAKTEGCEVTFWQQDENGRWQKQGAE